MNICIYIYISLGLQIGQSRSYLYTLCLKVRTIYVLGALGYSTHLDFGLFFIVLFYVDTCLPLSLNKSVYIRIYTLTDLQKRSLFPPQNHSKSRCKIIWDSSRVRGGSQVPARAKQCLGPRRHGIFRGTCVLQAKVSCSLNPDGSTLRKEASNLKRGPGKRTAIFQGPPISGSTTFVPEFGFQTSGLSSGCQARNKPTMQWRFSHWL